MGDITEGLRYLEIKELSHLLLQKRSKHVPFTHKNWRESYYFNATDEKQGLSLITTIGILPNKGRCSGFVMVLQKGRIAFSGLLLSRNIRLHETDRFLLKGLDYQVEGIDWRLGFGSKRCSFDILFRPLNEFFYYNNEKDEKDAANFNRLFSQHIEQAGLFEGEIIVNGTKTGFGPATGHRDHSWGIRDWASVDGYWLFSCTFGKGLAFNLWKGSSQGKPFQRGYYFDSEKNLNIQSCNINGQDKGKLGEPKGSRITFVDEEGKKHIVECQVICSVPIPLPGSIVYETIARMKLDNEVGFGLLERHVHDANPIHKIQTVLNLQRRRRKGP